MQSVDCPWIHGYNVSNFLWFLKPKHNQHHLYGQIQHSLKFLHLWWKSSIGKNILGCLYQWIKYGNCMRQNWNFFEWILNVEFKTRSLNISDILQFNVLNIKDMAGRINYFVNHIPECDNWLLSTKLLISYNICLCKTKIS